MRDRPGRGAWWDVGRASPRHCRPGWVCWLAAIDDPPDRARRQIPLRQESHRRALGDEIREVGLRMGRDQDHRGPAAPVVSGQAPGKVEPALIAQCDVDQDDLRPRLRRSPQPLRRSLGHADDAQALAFQENPSSLENNWLSSTIRTPNATRTESQAAPRHSIAASRNRRGPAASLGAPAHSRARPRSASSSTGSPALRIQPLRRQGCWFPSRRRWFRSCSWMCRGVAAHPPGDRR